MPSPGPAGSGQSWPPVLLCLGLPAQPSLCSPRYGGGSFSFSRLILSVTQRFSTEFELRQVRLDPGRVCGTRHQGPPALAGVEAQLCAAGALQPALCQQPLGGGGLLPLPLVCPGVWAASIPVPGCWGAAGGLLGVVGVPHTCSSSSSPRQLEQFKAENQDIGFGSGTRALEQALERTRANIRWVNENEKTVLAWFQGEIASS